MSASSAAFAVAQPLFDVLARNAEFFVYRQARPVDLLFLTILLTLGVPGALVLLEVLAAVVRPAAHRWVHLFFVGVLASLAALPALSRISVGVFAGLGFSADS